MSNWQPVCRESYPALYEYLLTVQSNPNKDGVCLSECWDFGLKDGVPVFDQRKVYVPFDGDEAFQWKVFIGKAEVDLDGYGPDRDSVHAEICEGFDYDPMAPDAAYWWTIIGEATDCIHANVEFTVGEIAMPMMYHHDYKWDHTLDEDIIEGAETYFGEDYFIGVPVWFLPSQFGKNLIIPKGSQVYLIYLLSESVVCVGGTKTDIVLETFTIDGDFARGYPGDLKIDLPGDMVMGIMPCDRAELKTKDSQCL